MPASFLENAAADPEVVLRLQAIDRAATTNAGSAMAEALRACLALNRPKGGNSDPSNQEVRGSRSQESAYLASAFKFRDTAFVQGLQAIQAIADQLEISGLNVPLSQHFQGAVLDGKLALGECVGETRDLLEQRAGALASVFATIGLTTDDIRQMSSMLTVDRSALLDVNVIMPGALDQLEWLVGHGIHDELRRLSGGGGSTRISPTVPIQKGVSLLLTDMVASTEVAYASHYNRRLVAGIVLSSEPSKLEVLGSKASAGIIGESNLSLFLLGALVATVGLLGGGGGMFLGGIVVMLLGMAGTLWATTGFVDP